jgi:GNAT superfamily N-acetyltransferase
VNQACFGATTARKLKKPAPRAPSCRSVQRGVPREVIGKSRAHSASRSNVMQSDHPAGAPSLTDSPATPTGTSAPAVILRIARRSDLPTILALLADDEIAQDRGVRLRQPSAAIEAVFDEIEADPNHELWLAELPGQGVVATLQLSFIPGLSRDGMLRAQVEAVRVRADQRNGGIGDRLMQFVIERARERGCGLMQLTSDRRREAAHRFYARMGFVDSHVGMKLTLHRN